MNNFKQSSIVIAILGVVLCHSPSLFSQELRDLSNLEKPTKQGRVLLVVFQNGFPAVHEPILTPKGVKVTDSYGQIHMELVSGVKHDFKILQNKQVLKIEVTADLETLVTIHLQKDSMAKTQIDQPNWQWSETQEKSDSQKKFPFRIQDERGRPVPAAQIMQSGSNTLLKSDNSGDFTLESSDLKGFLSIFHEAYESINLTLQDLDPQENLHTITLRPRRNELAEIIVLAPQAKGSLSSLVEIRKKSNSVTDGLAAEQMTRAGDSDAASSLRRVTGLTLVGGKYVYVRGLGERYSGVLMNGFNLPSPEPARRVVPLDLFPTSVMESILVQKSYSPDLPAEFGGGLIQLQTKSLPQSFQFKAQLSQNFEGVNNRLTAHSSSTDIFGFDDGMRALPSAIRNVLSQGKQLAKNVPGFDQGISEKELVALGQSLNNHYNTSRTDQTSLPSFTFSAGNGFSRSGLKIGVSGGGLYGQGTEQLNRHVRAFNVGSRDQLELDFDRHSEVSEVETRLAGNIDLGLDVAEHSQFRLSSFLLRNTTQLAQNDLSQNFGSGGNFTDSTVLDFTDRQLWTEHFSTNHDLTSWVDLPWALKTRVGYSQADRDSPDRREYRYNLGGGTPTLAADSAGNTRTWSELRDKSVELAINTEISPIKDHSDWLKIQLGSLWLTKDRQSDITRLYFGNDFSGESPIALNQSPEMVYQPANRRPGIFLLRNLTNTADSYSGEQNIQAQFIQFSSSPWESWTFNSGLRTETSIQEVKTFRYYEPETPYAQSKVQMKDALPAHSLTWKPSDRFRARLAYSETLARPDFRELSTVGFIDDETGYFVQGNSNLQGTVIKNWDQRTEYYFTSDEYASIGFFYKQFKNPIEVMFLPGVNRIQTFENAMAANNAGVEFETRFSLRWLTRRLRHFGFLTNLTIIKSAIELDATDRGLQTSSQRPLQGQSPYVLNAQLQYDLPHHGLSSTLLYNIVGPRITEVGTNGIPDTYEQAFGQLDWVLNQKISKDYFLGFRVLNLIDPVIISKQSDEMVRSFQRGREFRLSLGVIL